MALRAFGDGSLFAEALGESSHPRVLALHGWGRRGADFIPSLGDIPALAPDLPGFGASPPPAEVIGAHGYARALLPILGEFQEPPIVIGHSFGGRVAVCLAADGPTRVSGLVLTGVPLLRMRPPASPGAGYRLARWLHELGAIGDGRMESIRRKRGSADYRAATGIMRSILVKVVGESYEDQLARLTGRVAMLWGGEDTEVPVSVARAAAGILEGTGNTRVTLDVIEGVGHHVPVEAPGRLRDCVESLL